ncbi:CBS domain-containing protein [Kallotenue papyrolyticum]|uniref:CBS domain-containing protein n=1 Tax=Kallotenue papyrolyticum TaxID=1325125 RepID=UPI000492CC15|nr:CBS domain-containing protein [Kallotenue papyrolyticum]
MRIAEIMTREVQTVAPDSDLVTVAQYMKSLNVGVIPVVEEGRLLGVITDRDIVIRAIAEGRDPVNARARDHMTPDPTTVAPDDDVQRAAEIMAREQIRRLPVVEHGTLVGIVSLGDVAVDSGREQMTGQTLEEISTPSRPRTAEGA